MPLKISIITPTFNSEKYLERCIKSIQSQDYNNIEHIIIDGDSTDETRNIIKTFDFCKSGNTDIYLAFYELSLKIIKKKELASAEFFVD